MLRTPRRSPARLSFVVPRSVTRPVLPAVLNLPALLLSGAAFGVQATSTDDDSKSTPASAVNFFNVSASSEKKERMSISQAHVIYQSALSVHPRTATSHSVM